MPVSMAKKRLVVLYKELAELTHPICAKECSLPHSCCSKEYCEFAIEWARDTWGVELQRTAHDRLPLGLYRRAPPEAHVRCARV